MRIRASSVIPALVIATICVLGIHSFRHTSGWEWQLFAIPIWWAMYSVWALHGLHGSPAWYDGPLIFVLAVVMWVGPYRRGPDPMDAVSRKG